MIETKKVRTIFFSGTKVVFIYPDFTTALQGQWEKGVMVKSRQVGIKSMTEIEDTGMMTMEVTEPFGPVYERDVSDKKTLSKEPMLRDPYEKEMVEVKQSSIPGAGQGVFLKK